MLASSPALFSLAALGEFWWGAIVVGSVLFLVLAFGGGARALRSRKVSPAPDEAVETVVAEPAADTLPQAVVATAGEGGPDGGEIPSGSGARIVGSELDGFVPAAVVDAYRYLLASDANEDVVEQDLMLVSKFLEDVPEDLSPAELTYSIMHAAMFLLRRDRERIALLSGQSEHAVGVEMVADASRGDSWRMEGFDSIM